MSHQIEDVPVFVIDIFAVLHGAVITNETGIVFDEERDRLLQVDAGGTQLAVELPLIVAQVGVMDGVLLLAFLLNILHQLLFEGQTHFSKIHFIVLARLLC